MAGGILNLKGLPGYINMNKIKKKTKSAKVFKMHEIILFQQLIRTENFLK